MCGGYLIFGVNKLRERIRHRDLQVRNTILREGNLRDEMNSNMVYGSYALMGCIVV